MFTEDQFYVNNGLVDFGAHINPAINYYEPSL